MHDFRFKTLVAINANNEAYIDVFTSRTKLQKQADDYQRRGFGVIIDFTGHPDLNKCELWAISTLDKMGIDVNLTW